MKSDKQRKGDRRLLLIFGGGALLILLLNFIVITPRGKIYRHKLQSLRLEQVQTLRLHTEDLVDGELDSKERVLSKNEITKILAMISEAKSYHPNHPRGGWTVFVDIETTTDIPRFSFLIHSTWNNGVHFNLWSSATGRDGWGYGTLRNDALGPFVETLFRKENRP